MSRTDQPSGGSPLDREFLSRLRRPSPHEQAQADSALPPQGTPAQHAHEPAYTNDPFAQPPLPATTYEQAFQPQAEPAQAAAPDYYYPNEVAPQHPAADQGYADPNGFTAAKPGTYDPFQQQQPRADAPAFRGSTFDDAWPNTAPPAANNPHDYSLDQYGGHHPAAAPAFGGDGYDPYAAAGDLQAAQGDGQGLMPHEQAYGADDEYEDDYYDDEEPERGTAWKRGVIVAASLVIAAAIGGGLAYGWRTFGGGAGEAGASPVIAAGSGPSKVAPEKPGGRQFANTDSKLLGRLDNGRGVPAAEDRSRSRVKPVAVLDVRPDGTIVPSARKPEPEAPATRAQPAPSGNNDVVVPGMTIVGVPQQTPQAAPAAPSTSTSGRAAPVQPRVLTTQPANPRIPQITNRADDRATEETRTASLGGTAPVINARTSDAGTGPVPLPSRNALPGRDQIAALPSAPAVTRAPQQQPAAPQTSNLSTGSSGANGYVAVLASQNSRIAALTAFADLRQRYGTVLSSAIPDVQKADLSSRGLGTMYRVVVGPPGSRAAANKTCSKLRTAGYTGCWVKAY